VAAAIVCAGIFTWRMTGVLDLRALSIFAGSLAGISLFGWLASILLRLKFVTGLPGHPWYRTLHLTPVKMTFFDRSLNKNVRYARHALAIDERREDFDRVPWVNDGKAPNRELAEGPWFTQYWFAGNHSD